MTDTKHSTRITLRQTAPKSMPHAQRTFVHLYMYVCICAQASKAENTYAFRTKMANNASNNNKNNKRNNNSNNNNVICLVLAGVCEQPKPFRKNYEISATKTLLNVHSTATTLTKKKKYKR